MTDYLSQFLNSDFMQQLLYIILRIVMVLVNLILLPFSVLLKALIPSLDAGLLAIASFFSMASSYAAWVINALLIPTTPLLLIAAFYSASLTIWLFAYGIKIAIKWKKAIWQ
jgi:hypothetical protein